MGPVCSRTGCTLLYFCLSYREQNKDQPGAEQEAGFGSFSVCAGLNFPGFASLSRTNAE